MLNKGEMTTEKAIDVMSDTGFLSPASSYTEAEQLAALYLAIRILEEKAEEEAKMQEEQAEASGRWEERKVADGNNIEEWQSARCSVCGKYHTTPYLYTFYDYKYCPNCGARMETK